MSDSYECNVLQGVITIMKCTQYWLKNNASDLPSWGAQFEFLKAHRLSWLRFMSFISVPIGKGVHIQRRHKRMARFHKLTRNLFLTLHGHNVHRQQRKLSKFLMRYQQFASHAYCGAAGPVSKMALQQEKAFCVLRFEVSRSVVTVQRELRARFRKDALMRLF